MDTFSDTTSPIISTPTTEPVLVQREAQHSPIPQSPKGKFSSIVLISIVVILLVVTGFLLIQSFFTSQSLPSIGKDISPESSQKTADSTASNDNPDLLKITPNVDIWSEKSTTPPQYLFLKKVNLEENIIEAWTMDSNGTNLQQLAIPNLRLAFKHPTSNLVFYFTKDDQDTFFIKNIATNKELAVEFPQHPDPNAIENLSFQNTLQISPDGRYALINLFNTAPCPTPSPDTTQMGHGPCEPAESLELPNGYYLLDLQTKKFVLLDSSSNPLRVSQWDLSKNTLSYVEYSHPLNYFYEVNLQTYGRVLIESTDFFGYMAYPFQDKLVRFTGKTEYDTNVSFINVSIAEIGNFDTTPLDQGSWAEIQPFALISPDQDKFIYPRQKLSPKGIGIQSLHLYSTADTTIKQITPNDDSLSFSTKGFWIDNENIITLVDTIEEENYTNGNNFLVRINTTSGEMTYLTQKPEVFVFTEF